PKSSLSSTPSASAAQLTATNGWAARALARGSSRAMSSLAGPPSPRRITVEPVRAARAATSATRARPPPPPPTPPPARPPRAGPRPARGAPARGAGARARGGGGGGALGRRPRRGAPPLVLRNAALDAQAEVVGVPGLEHVVVHVALVDGREQHLAVGVGREQ